MEAPGLVTGVMPDYVVRVGHADQVRDVVRLARECRVNLVASSSGAPHFRGASLLDRKGVIVDLSGMDRIVRINRRHKVGLIEPGVRFGSALRGGGQRRIEGPDAVATESQ